MGGTLIRIVLGLLLLSAAAFKAHGFWTGTAQPMPLLPSPRAQVVVIESEALLGFWLLSGLYRRAARNVAFIFFCLLACVSLYLALLGESSCRCFGRVQVNPWLTFALNLGAMMGLIFARFTPHAEGDSATSKSRSARIPVLACLAAFVIVIFAGLFIATDDLWAGLARLRGDFITVEPAITDVGSGLTGERRDFTVSVINNAEHSVRFIGGTSSCACMATDDLPLTLAPGERRLLRVRMTFNGSQGLFQERFVLYTDQESQTVVVSRFHGRVMKPPG
jgi:hypothetical protein